MVICPAGILGTNRIWFRGRFYLVESLADCVNGAGISVRADDRISLCSCMAQAASVESCHLHGDHTVEMRCQTSLNVYIYIYIYMMLPLPGFNSVV